MQKLPVWLHFLLSRQWNNIKEKEIVKNKEKTKEKKWKSRGEKKIFEVLLGWHRFQS